MVKTARYQGCLLGLAVGDALGTTLKFKKPGSFKPIIDLAGGGPFSLEAGQWTDDTSMALCLAESLLICQGFDPADQMERYLRWYREGYLSSTGTCFDIGNTTRAALTSFKDTGEPFSGPTHPWSAGNGSIMRLAPVVMYFAQGPCQGNPPGRRELPHHPRGHRGGGRMPLLGSPPAGRLLGESKETLLSPMYTPISGLWAESPLPEKIAAIAQGSFKEKNLPEIRGTGYVVDSLEAALWAFYHGDDFQEGALLAVNLGDDADTTGAVYGQMVGAYYGVQGIPEEWLEKIVWAEEIKTLAADLAEKASS